MNNLVNSLNLIGNKCIELQGLLNSKLEETVDPILIINLISYCELEYGTVNLDNLCNFIIGKYTNAKIKLPENIYNTIISNSFTDSRYVHIFNLTSKIDVNKIYEIINISLNLYKIKNPLYINQDISGYIDDVIPILTTQVELYLTENA